MIFDILKINFLPFNVALTSSKLFIVLRFEANFQSNLTDTLIAKIKGEKMKCLKFAQHLILIISWKMVNFPFEISIHSETL